MATQQPERITDMVLMASTPYFPEECRELLSQMLDTEWDDMWNSTLMHHHTSPEQVDTLRKQFHSFKNNYDDMNFTPPLLSTIKSRTLIIHGGRDTFFPADIPIILYKSIPDSYLWIMPNNDHAVHAPTISHMFKTIHNFLMYKWENL
jgi:pimeloyl-ACP methyl ester carboxylesterase